MEPITGSIIILNPSEQVKMTALQQDYSLECYLYYY